MTDASFAPGVSDLVHSKLRDGTEVELGPIVDSEHGQLFSIFAEVVSSKAGYPHSAPLTKQSYDATFVASVTIVVVARVRALVVGSYYLKPNSPGRGAHIANAGYLVARDERSKGIGRILVSDSIKRAPLLGFDAIQFNLVFASNPARKLYEELGWRQIGLVPKAIDGEDAVIYHRFVP